MYPAKAFIIILLLVLNGTASATAPLSRAKVLDWMETRAGEFRLQERMKANAERPDDLPRAFHEKRREWLLQRGWDVTDYDGTGQRIAAAREAMRTRDKLDERADERESEREEIRNNPYFNEEQKAGMLEALDQLHEARLRQLDATRADWPAVEPYREQLEQLTSWIAGNRETPPVLE